MTSYWVLASQPWAIALFHDTLRYLPGTWWAFTNEVALERARQHYALPDKLFSLHWHWLVPADMTRRVECIGFHASDLPNFRGGAPIQNQLKRGITSTKLTAFRLDAGLDTGPIYAQLPLSLDGTRTEIFERIAGLVARLVPPLLAEAFVPRAQQGQGSYYTRQDAEDYQWV